MTTGLRKDSPQPDAVVPRPRGAHAAKPRRAAARLEQTALEQTQPIAVRPDPALSGAGPAQLPGRRLPGRNQSKARAVRSGVVRSAAAEAVRSAAADVAAALTVLTVVPLALMQLPDAIAWAVPPQFAAAGPATVNTLLRLSGLALIALTATAPLGAAAVRRFRAWPVLVCGLAIFAVADLFGNVTRSVAQVGIDRFLHGAGAGLAVVATIALVTERRGRIRRLLAGWWAACAVTALIAAPELMRHRVAGGDWHAALRPYPWLTGMALGCAALYALLAEPAVTAGTRSEFPAAERTQLALLGVPVTGMGVIAVAVTFRGDVAVVAGAIAELASLAGLAIMAARTSGARSFAVVAAIAGCCLAPAAGAMTDLLHATAAGHPVAMLAGLRLTEVTVCACVLCIAALAGGVVVVAVPRRLCGVAATAGLLVAAGGFTLGAVTETAGLLSGARLPFLGTVCATVAAGFAAAVTAALRGTGQRLGPPGAMGGVVLLLAGVLSGYLADGALELSAVDPVARSAQAVQTALITTNMRWNAAAATITGFAAFGCLFRLITCGFQHGTAGAPTTVAGHGADHG